MKNYIQFCGNEQCGVLTGVKVGNDTYRICKFSPPCVSENSRCGCKRDAEKANSFIKEDFHKSEHTRFYIGEWHTHPEKNPTPSSVDYSSIQEIFKTASLVAPIIFMIIVGTEGLHISVYNGDKFERIDPLIV